MEYDELTLGQLKAILNKMGGMEGVKRFLSDKLVITEYKFNVWKTIELGTGLKTADDFRHALCECGVGVDNLMSKIFENPAFTVAIKKTEIDLIRVALVELDLRGAVQRGQIYECAKEFDLELCSPEVGPQLCLQCQDEDLPFGERVFIAMEPILVSPGHPEVFCLERRGKKILGGYWSGPRAFWDAGDGLWIFRRPRRK